MKIGKYFFFDDSEFPALRQRAAETKPGWNIYKNMLPVISQFSGSVAEIPSFVPELLYDGPFEHMVSYHRFKWLRYWYMNHLSSRKELENVSAKVLSVMLNWLEAHHRPTRPVWEPYSVSERVINWLWCLAWLGANNSIGFAHRKLLEAAMLAHLSYLENNLEYHGEKTNNHIIKDAQGLMYGGSYFFEDRNAARWRATAGKILLEELDREFSKNYVHLEQTSHYHCLVTRRYLECYLLAGGTEPELAKKLSEPVRRMVDAVYHMTFNDSTIPLFSDVSPDEPPEIAPRTVLGMGGLIFKEDKYLVRAAGLNYEALWLLGGRALGYDKGKILNGKEKRSNKGFIVYPRSFAAYDGKDLCLRIDCGPLGFEPNPGHGHDDPLSIQLWNSGQLWIRDSGIYSYDDAKWKTYFRSRSAHSTVSIDPEGKKANSGAFGKKKRVVGTGAVEPAAHPVWSMNSDKIFALLCECNHLESRNKINHRRLVVASKYPEYILVADLLNGEGVYSVRQTYHLDCEDIEVQKNIFELVKGIKRFSLLSLCNNTLEHEIGKSHHSPCYGSIIEKPVISFKTESELPAVLCTVMKPGRAAGLAGEISLRNGSPLDFIIRLNFDGDQIHFIGTGVGNEKNSKTPLIGEFDLACLIKESGKAPILISEGNCSLNPEFVGITKQDIKNFKTSRFERVTY